MTYSSSYWILGRFSPSRGWYIFIISFFFFSQFFWIFSGKYILCRRLLFLLFWNMKKRIVSLFILGMYFFVGFCIGISQNFAATSSCGSTVSIWGPNDMTSTDFILNPTDLSPSQKEYKNWTQENFKDILASIGQYLLIATTTLSVLSIVVGGLIISTTGPSDRAAKGKTIIVLNITAIVIALFSYSIIQLVSWIIA